MSKRISDQKPESSFPSKSFPAQVQVLSFSSWGNVNMENDNSTSLEIGAQSGAKSVQAFPLSLFEINLWRGEQLIITHLLMPRVFVLSSVKWI